MVSLFKVRRQPRRKPDTRWRDSLRGTNFHRFVQGV